MTSVVFFHNDLLRLIGEDNTTIIPSMLKLICLDLQSDPSSHFDTPATYRPKQQRVLKPETSLRILSHFPRMF